MGRPISSKIAPVHGWSVPHLINGSFLGPTLLHNTNGILIGSAIFAGLTTATDRQTDRQTGRQTTLFGL